ncbi:hypothetical protein Vi05172_g954 [Venturia inaequalis]|nr:hypothetical protein Vi05172_g954 [Venturia inaequalis]
MHLLGIFSMAIVLALAATSFGAPQGNSDLNERDLVAIVVSSNNNHQACDTESCDSFCQDNHLKGGDCDDDGNCICDWNFAERVLGTRFGKVPESAHDHGHRQAENFCFSPVCNAECQKNQNMNGYCDDGECLMVVVVFADMLNSTSLKNAIIMAIVALAVFMSVVATKIKKVTKDIVRVVLQDEKIIAGES